MKLSLKRLADTVLYGNDKELLENPYRKSQNYFIFQAIATTLYGIIIGGSFVNGFAIELGASDKFVSYFALLSSLSGFALIFSNIVFKKITSQKKFVLRTLLPARIILCLGGIIPYLNIPYKTTLLFAFQLIAYVAYSYSTTVLNTWFMGLVPMNIRGRYVSLRSGVCTVISMFIPVLAGLFMDSMGSKLLGYSIFCIIGFFVALAEFYFFSKVQDIPIDKKSMPKTKLFDTLIIPMKNKKFISFVLSLVVFYILYYISASYQQVYYIKYMKLPYAFINTMVLLGAIIQLFAYKFWGRICDRKGAKFVLNTAIWFYVLEYIMWSFSNTKNIYMIGIIASIFVGIAIPGFSVGTFNRRFELYPKDEKMAYESFFIISVAVALLISLLISAAFKNQLSSIEWLTKSIEHGEIKGLFIVTAIGLLIYQLISLFMQIKNKEITFRRK